MERVLISGASGLIGKELLKMLQEEYDCWVIGKENVYNSKVHFIKQNIGDAFEIEKFPQKLDYIIHLAQAKGHNNFPENADEIFRVNLFGIVQLLNYGVKVGIKKFLYASSGGIYGISNKMLDENNRNLRWNELNFYQGTKLCSEILASSYEQFFKIISFRFFFVYGEGQKQEMLFPRLIRSIKQGEKIIIGSKNDIKMNPIYKTDAAKCVYKALKKINEHQTFNIAGTQIVTLGEIVSEMERQLEKKAVVCYADRGQSDMIADIRKMQEALCEPEVSLYEGVKKIIN